jgi:hypothetical protein
MAYASSSWPGLLAVLGAACLSLPLSAQPVPSVERVFAKGGRVCVVANGATNLLEKELTLPNEIKVKTNATFRVKGGKERKLEEGQVLGADGVLTSPDGSVAPVFDNLAVKRGKVVLFKDGDASVLQSEYLLGDGFRITPEAYRVAPDGFQEKLLDGQMFRLDGQSIPVRDTITLANGKVRVQKDGSMLDVPLGRSMMMNDGTKVFGDGTVVFRDGSTRKLSEGEILAVEGLVRLNQPGMPLPYR